MKPAHLPQLDGVRGIAVLIVVLGHLIVFGFGFGLTKLGPVPPIGVNLFFVLSGFLITNILLRTRKANAYYRSFYARRALRIWPLYAVVLFLCYGVLNGRVFSFDPSAVRFKWFALMLQNIVYVKIAAPLALLSTWSLAVEEQFYLIWPSIVKHCGGRTLCSILVSVVLMAPFARYVVMRVHLDPYTNPLCRFDGMALGGLVAYWFDHRAPSRETVYRVILALIFAAVLLIAVAHVFRAEQLFDKSGTNLLFTAVLLGALRIPRVAAILGTYWLRKIGEISYGAYLMHTIVAAIVFRFFPSQTLTVQLLRVSLILLGTYVTASASFRLFESPILRLKRYFPAESANTGLEPAPQSKTVLLSSARLPIVVLVGILLAQKLAAQEPSPPDWANIHRFESQNELLLRSFDPNRVVLVGDSITEHWIVYDPAFFRDTSLVDRGIYGQVTPQMLVRFGPDVVALRPKTVVILAGTNDLAGKGGPESLAFIEGNLRSMAQLAKANHIRVILSSILPVSDVYKPETTSHNPRLIRELNKWMETYCSENHFTFLDYTSALSDQEGHLRRDLTDDGLHPNLAGYKAMEPLLIRAIHSLAN